MAHLCEVLDIEKKTDAVLIGKQAAQLGIQQIRSETFALTDAELREEMARISLLNEQRFHADPSLDTGYAYVSGERED